MPDTWILNQQQRNKIDEKKPSRQPLSRQKLRRKKTWFHKKKCFESHLKQQWTTIASATTMKVVHTQEKIGDVATKPTIFELKPLEPKKNFSIFFKIFQVPLETRMNSTCNYNGSCLKQKKQWWGKFRCGNIADKTWPNKRKSNHSIFQFSRNFFFNFLYTEKKNPSRTRTSELRVQRQLLYLRPWGKQPGTC